MYARTPALVALALPLLTVAAFNRPVEARRQVPSIRGSYFGNFLSSGGDIWPTDMTLSFQSASRVGGQLNVAGTIQGMTVTGSYSGSGKITLIGRTSGGQRPLKIRLSGKVQPGENADRVTITGTYSATGSVKEAGNFELVGFSNDPRDF